MAASSPVACRSASFLRRILFLPAVAGFLVVAACAETPQPDPLEPGEPQLPDADPQNTFSTPQFDVALWTAIHSSGVYVVGYSEGSLDGPHRGGRDPIIRKYHPEGDLLWADQFGSSSDEIPFDVVVDAAGNVYITGHTMGSLAGGRGGVDAFILKYDADGNRAWTRQFGTTGTDYGYAVALEPGGNVVVVGSTTGVLAGAGSGGTDAFVRRYSPDGDVLWTRQFGNGTSTQAAGVASAGDGSLYVVGTTLGDLQGTQLGEGDVFVRKYGPGGGVAWTRQFGTPAYDVALRARVDPAGNVIVSGQTNGELVGTHAGLGDVFVRKYTSAGAAAATRQFGTPENETAWGLAVDDLGNYYIAGFTSGDLAGSIGGADVFVRKYNSSNSVAWTRQFGTTLADEAYGIAAAAPSEIFVAGATEGALVGSNQGGYDAFLSRLNQQGNIVWTDQ